MLCLNAWAGRHPEDTLAEALRVECVVGVEQVTILPDGIAQRWRQALGHRNASLDRDLVFEERLLLVLIWKRPLEPLSIFQDPGIRRLVWYVIPAVHTMVADILLEGAPTDTMATNQARTTHQLASGAALREVNPAALRGRAAADLPRLLSR